MKTLLHRRAVPGTAALCVVTAITAVTALAVIAAPARAAPAGEVLGAGNFIHVVAHLDRTIAFYHDVLGLQQATFGGAAPAAPRFAPDPPVAQLYAIPQSTPVGVAVLRLPEQGIGLEFAEFRNVAQASPRPRPQDPGASVLVLTVRNLDTILRQARAAHVPVVTTGGQPVAQADAGTTTRSIVLRDPDGYYIELVEHEPVTDSQTAGNVLHAQLMLSVADTRRTVHYYQDLLGLALQVDASFAPDSALSKTFGVRHALFRHSIATLPGSDFKYDFVEWKGVVRHPAQARVFDHGVGVLRLVVGDVDSFVGNLKTDDVRVASTGDGPVALNARFHACILADPNGLYIEPVPHFQPRRPQVQATPDQGK